MSDKSKNSAKNAHAESVTSKSPSTKASFMTRSKASQRSSSKSSVIEAAALARASAEAMQAKIAYVKQQQEIIKKKAQLDIKKATLDADQATLDADFAVLEIEGEAAAAKTKAEVLEEAAGVVDSYAASAKSSVPSQVVQQRIEEYVQHQAQLTQDSASPPHKEILGNNDKNPTFQISPGDSKTIPTRIYKPSIYERAQAIEHAQAPRSPANPQQDQSNPQQYEQCIPQRYDQTVPKNRYTPLQYVEHIKSPSHEANPPQMEGFAKFLARRELVTTGLSKFDDTPENYRAWESSFLNATRGLGLTYGEELDLLVKWLGKESSEHVRRIRSVYVTNPQAALYLSWQRLQECYATPEIVENALFKRLDNFPRLTAKDNIKLRELSDLLMELLAAKNEGHLPGLNYLDTPRGVKPVVEKLPPGLQEKWLSTGSRYKEEQNVIFPPFSFFVDFVCAQAKARNDPSFFLSTSGQPYNKIERTPPRQSGFKSAISVRKTDVSTADTDHTSAAESEKRDSDPARYCPVHNKPHPLAKCRAFKMKPLQERKNILKEHKRCYKCCSPNHLAKDCQATLKCNECESDRHCSAMHPTISQPQPNTCSPTPQADAEPPDGNPLEVTARCTKVCGKGSPARSCAKVCLAQVFPRGQPEHSIKVYVILDDQSNRSLARSEFFQLFGIEGSLSPYLMRTCAGTTEMTGRKAVGFQIKAMNGGECLDLPPLIECNEIMTNKSEIPTPDVALAHAHLKHIAPCIPQLDPDAQMMILLGRDMIRVHKVRQQVNGPHDSPFAQRLDLGWVIVGEVCIDNAHKPTLNVFRTQVLQNGRPSILTPCPNNITVKEKPCYGGEHKYDFPNRPSRPMPAGDNLGHAVFERTAHDNKNAMSFEDETFLKIMEQEVHQDELNNWVAPLPFKSPRPMLPNNREQALSRLSSLRRTLNKNCEMKEQFSAFMDKLFENKHAEKASPVREEDECWYLPTFGVYHPQKPGQIRVVFDSSAQQHGVSLNSVLLTGPDLNNTLLGVLVRFRKEPIAVTADIRQMFYAFLVRHDHRDYLRFLWHKDNDLSKEVEEYRMRVHVFGNSPSPAVAIYGLRRAAQKGEPKYGADTQQFVERHFYVDDGLISLPTESAAIDLMKRTCASLAESNLKLHKIASNSVAVMQAFEPEELASNIKDLGLDDETLPVQRSLGLCWDISTDTFTFKVAVTDKPYTRRGVLSVVNSIFDPLGFAAPVTVRGRLLLRELSSGVQDWDAPLPDDKMPTWEAWKTSLQELSSLQVPRCYVPMSLSRSTYTELCLFSDASNWAIGAVAYLRTVTEEGRCKVGFVLGKAKLSPQPEPTIPRLELCGAVLAVEMADVILDELDHKPDAVKFYCDSKVVLGYICNDTKRFFVYVHNRVQRIRQTTCPDQWHYIASEQNPADLATRSVPASQLMDTMWFKGPDFLHKPPGPEVHEVFEMIDPEVDVEVKPQITTLSTHVEAKRLTSERFLRFSTWESMLRAISLLIHQARSFKADTAGESQHMCKGWHQCCKPRTPEELAAAKKLILESVQRDSYPDEYAALQANKEVSNSSTILNLDPYISDGLLRVGGRLRHASIEPDVKNPIILPKQSHVTKLLVKHHHIKVKHQGRQFTEGAIRAAGLWIVAGKRLIGSILHHCVICRKLRGKLEVQKMADLPPERLDTSPPFTYVGLDVFGPWTVITRRTRGGAAQNKRWAILFTCMSTRGVHIELMESMDTSSCINALRRFFAVRGPAKQLWSDRGTNFVAASSELGMSRPQEKQNNILRYLHSNGCTWKFNPPHASHMGGVWERMIGVTRRILDSMLLQDKRTRLTHDVLSTLMAEVSAIVNARPLVPISSDSAAPFLLSPAMLLTQKQSLAAPPGDFTGKDLLKYQWRQVQALANEFWSRWRNEYISTLHSRRKWHRTHRNLQTGDIVLLKQSQAPRNQWPMAMVTSTFPGTDGRVRKVEVRTSSQGTPKTYLRPVSDVIILLEKD